MALSDLLTVQPGMVSHGTLRPEDLIPRFSEALDLIRESTYCLSVHVPENDYWAARELNAAVDSLLADIERAQKSEGYWFSDECMEHLDLLISALDSLAPEGHYFGSHVGDGSDFGFWELESED